MDIIVACHLEDVAAEFLSVVDRDLTQPLQLVTLDTGVTSLLPAENATQRHELLQGLSGQTTNLTESLQQSRLGALLKRLSTEAARVWTHCPADERADRAFVGWVTAQEWAQTSVLHSVGASVKYQFRCDVTTSLSTEQIQRKLTFPSITRVPTEAMCACERFTRLTDKEASGLYALRHSLDADASVVSDPWDFRQSPYEGDRLRNTSTWVASHVPPGRGSLVEIGSCEGALTTQLLDAGHDVVANEPNERFRSRLATVVDGRATITEAPLEELARDGVAATAYLLIEMVYYLEDLSILDELSTDLMLIGVAPEYFSRRVEPWLIASPTWTFAERVELTPPKVEFVAGHSVYQRKAGSIGVLCRKLEEVN